MLAISLAISLTFSLNLSLTAEAEPTGPEVAKIVEAAPLAGDLVLAKRVAVYALELQGVAPNIGTVVTDSLLAEVRKLQGVSAIGMDEIRDMLSHEANKQIMGCQESDSCLAEIAGALGVDDLVTGKLSRVGDNHVLTVRRIDQRRAEVVGAVNKRLKAESGQEFLLAIGPAIEELFAERPLREGTTRGVPKEVALRLNPPPLPAWAFYSVAGGALGAGAISAFYQILANDAADEHNDYAKDGLTGTVQGARLVSLQDKANGRVTGARATIGIASALAISAAVMYFFTDWEGYGEGAE